jgi:hypothetical protein
MTQEVHLTDDIKEVVLLVTKVIEEEMGPLKSAALVEKIREGVKAKYGSSNIEQDCKSSNEDIDHEDSFGMEDFQARLIEMEKEFMEINMKAVEGEKKLVNDMTKAVEDAAVKAKAIELEMKKLKEVRNMEDLEQFRDSLAAERMKLVEVKIHLENVVEAFTKRRAERFAFESKGGVKSNTA